MQITINRTFTAICALLVIVNVFIFIKGIGLSEQISYYENEIKNLQRENIEIEQKIYTFESITKTASMAADLEYGKYNKPIFTEKPQYAFNK